jgi:hypothetical protein
VRRGLAGKVAVRGSIFGPRLRQVVALFCGLVRLVIILRKKRVALHPHVVHIRLVLPHKGCIMMTRKELVEALFLMARQSSDAANAGQAGALADAQRYGRLCCDTPAITNHEQLTEVYARWTERSRNVERLRKESEVLTEAARIIADR